MTSDRRPGWDATWMAVAQTLSLRSRCVRAQVGCVIVAADQNPVAVGYNGPPAGLQIEGTCDLWCPRAMGNGENLDPTYEDCVTSHAEMNALAKADYSRMRGATLYTSSAICFPCAKTVANSGVVRIVQPVSELIAYRNPRRTMNFLEQCGLEVVVWPTS